MSTQAKGIPYSAADIKTKDSALSFAARHNLLPPPTNPAVEKRAARATAKVDKAQTSVDATGEALAKATKLHAEFLVVRDRYNKMECGFGFFHQLARRLLKLSHSLPLQKCWSRKLKFSRASLLSKC